MKARRGFLVSCLGRVCLSRLRLASGDKRGRRAVVARGHLADYLKPLTQAAYITGWRTKSELLTRQWRHVDLTAGWLRLDPGQTKNGERPYVSANARTANAVRVPA
jgi:hypothetical protein